MLVSESLDLCNSESQSHPVHLASNLCVLFGASSNQLGGVANTLVPPTRSAEEKMSTRKSG